MCYCVIYDIMGLHNQKGVNTMKNQKIYVNQLSEKEQESILNQVSLHLYQMEGIRKEEQEEALENAQNSKLNDLTGIIDVSEYL